tara:strand:+ start:775 stop:963 length:189 start_codon:yes stop_codon:yes gene_type:complete
MITDKMVDEYNAKHDDKILTLFAIEMVEMFELILKRGTPITEREALALDATLESEVPEDALI